MSSCDSIERLPRHMKTQLDDIWSDTSGCAASRWTRICRDILTPETPLDVHRALHVRCYSGLPLPHPAWYPTQVDIEHANTTLLARDLHLNGFDELRRFSHQQKEQFWTAVLDRLQVRFMDRPKRIFDQNQYLIGARMNIAESCFGRNADDTAIVFQREGDSRVLQWSQGKLEMFTNLVASSLCSLGYQTGDAIGLDMQMTAESVAIYLGIVKAGMVVVSIADSFSATEIATRLNIADTKLVFTQDFIYRGGKQLPLYERIISAGASRIIVLPGMTSESDLTTSIATVQCDIRAEDLQWNDFISRGSDSFSAVPVSAMAPSNILFSSGTTGTPKAIVWNHSTPIKCATDGWLHMDIQSGERVFFPSNPGWMMAPWLIYASLMNNATMALYCGSPTTHECCEFISKARVALVGLVPSIARQLRQSGATDGVDWSHVRRYLSTGEASNPLDALFLMSRKKGYAPVIEYCGGTELGGGYISGSLVQPQAPACFSTYCFGIDAVLLRDGREVEVPECAAAEGEVALIGPSLGFSTTILNRDHRKVYFDGMPLSRSGECLRRHGDLMHRFAGGAGYHCAMGRADDSMNLGGIKVGSLEIEKVCNTHKLVLESAAVGVNDTLGQQTHGSGPSKLVVFVVLNRPSTDETTVRSQLVKEMRSLVKKHINPLFRVADIVLLPKLPRTSTGKIMRRVLRDKFASKQTETHSKL